MPIQPGRTKRKAHRNKEMDKVLHLWRGAEGKERFPPLGKPSSVGRSSGTEEELLGTQRRGSNLSMAGQHKTYIGGKCQSPWPQPETGVC